MRNVIMLIGAISLFIGLSLNHTVHAKDTKHEPMMSNVALSQTTAENVDQSVIDYLEENDVNIDNESIIEVLPLRRGDHTQSLLEDDHHTILSVSNVVDGQLHKDILVTYTKNNDNTLDVVDAVLNSEEENDAKNLEPTAGQSDEFPPSSDDRLTVTATAVYDFYLDGNAPYYSPYGVYFIYTKGTANNVSKISTNYITNGGDYSYPDFNYLGPNASHSVEATQVNPAANTIYSKTDYYPSDKVIHLVGGTNPGHFITFTINVDGKTLTDTTTLDQ